MNKNYENKYFTNRSIEKYVLENDIKSIKRSLGCICYTIDLLNGNFDKAVKYVEEEKNIKIREKFNSNIPLVYNKEKSTYSGRDLGLAVAYLQENFCDERIEDVKKVSKMIDKKNEEEQIKENLKRKEIGTSPNVKSRQFQNLKKKAGLPAWIWVIAAVILVIVIVIIILQIKK